MNPRHEFGRGADHVRVDGQCTRRWRERSTAVKVIGSGRGVAIVDPTSPMRCRVCASSAPPESRIMGTRRPRYRTSVASSATSPRASSTTTCTQTVKDSGCALHRRLEPYNWPRCASHVLDGALGLFGEAVDVAGIVNVLVQNLRHLVMTRAARNGRNWNARTP